MAESSRGSTRKRSGRAHLQNLLGWARMEEADRNLDRAGELLDKAENWPPTIPASCCPARGPRPQPCLFPRLGTARPARLAERRERARRQRTARKGRLRPDRPARGGLAGLRRRQAPLSRAGRPPLPRSEPAGQPAQGVLHRNADADIAARRGARRHRAAAVHRRLPALGHDAGRADFSAHPRISIGDACRSSTRSPTRWCAPSSAR